MCPALGRGEWVLRWGEVIVPRGEEEEVPGEVCRGWSKLSRRRWGKRAHHGRGMFSRRGRGEVGMPRTGEVVAPGME